jgi:hypothetical protein
MVKAIKRSPIIQALQLSALFMGGATWQQKQTHISFVSVALAEIKFRCLGKCFYGTK